ncbi:hypothetical protein RND71_016353 [Anisodus tanguticus]|uniref:Uncharacterized protein n=1 Tax=Anisodus tanguticus TaxID=243964 RepID=A0AAE1S7M2_9SOLA|nr:hypothetical protein RND71_016353 [Anisodus tanguticus]
MMHCFGSIFLFIFKILFSSIQGGDILPFSMLTTIIESSFRINLSLLLSIHHCMA